MSDDERKLKLSRTQSAPSAGVSEASLQLADKRYRFHSIRRQGSVEVQFSGFDASLPSIPEKQFPAIQRTISDVDAQRKLQELVVRGENADAQEILVQLHRLLRVVKQCEDRNRAVTNAYIDAQYELVKEFEKKAIEIFHQFEARKEPQRKEVEAVQVPLGHLMEGKYVEISAGFMDAFQSRFGRNRFGVLYNEQNKQLRVEDSADFLVFLDEVRRRRKEQLDKEQQEAKWAIERELELKKRESERERRALLALENILPAMPQLSLEEAMRALELNGDDPSEAIVWCLEQDPDVLSVRLAPAVQSKPAPERTPSTTVASHAPIDNSLREDPGFKDEVANPTGRYLVFKVKRFCDDETLELALVLDRNRIPSAVPAHETYRIPLRDLLHGRTFRVLDENEEADVKAALEERVPVITYQCLHEDEFCPINIAPQMPLNEYKMEWDVEGKTISSVTHRDDGAIVFRPVLDEGKGLGFVDASSPIECYSQVIDEVTQNIVHIHLDDTRSDIAIDTINLTGTDETVEDVMSFDKDASGRDLTYKIVVYNQEIEAILYKLGNDIKRASFIEHKIPPVDSMVSLPDDKLGLVTSIPAGLIVSNSGSEYTVDAPGSEQVGSCVRKHPMELQGFLEVTVIMEEGKLCTEPRRAQYPVCQLFEATAEQQRKYYAAKQQSVANEVHSLLSLLTVLEDAVARRPGSKGHQMNMADLGAVRKQIHDSQNAPAIVNSPRFPEIKQRIAKAFNGIRLLAMERRFSKP